MVFNDVYTRDEFIRITISLLSNREGREGDYFNIFRKKGNFRIGYFESCFLYENMDVIIILKNGSNLTIIKENILGREVKSIDPEFCDAILINRYPLYRNYITPESFIEANIIYLPERYGYLKRELRKALS